jgi:flagellar export protein FliJ
MAEKAERECAAQVATLQVRLADAERSCVDLQRYLGEYQNMFQQRASAGIGVGGMRDYQTFIARLSEGVRQQQVATEQLRAECARARARWVDAAVRKSAVGKLIANVHAEVQKIEDRRSQIETDEYAQRLGGVR